MKEMSKRFLSTKEMALVGLFSALIIVGAFLRIPIPYVPISMQVMFTLLCSVMLGAKLGALSVFIYILLGLVGVPVFTQGGGIGYVLVPTFGYIIGFFFQAIVTGKIINIRKEANFWWIFFGCVIGVLVIYAVGVFYFYMINTFYLGKVISAKILLINCFLITLPGDIFSCVVVSLLGVKLTKSRIR